jgi:NAD(P)H-dependent flavin oxidoreductase YrpB (nitropropane dioxygenase family)
VAANLLVPFAKSAHVRACIDAGADAVVLFFGFAQHFVRELQEAGIFVIHQVGEPTQARRALADGADAVIAQGLEAGGHLLATKTLDEFLPSVLEAAGDKPVLAAGGIVDGTRVRAVLDAGASAAVCGTRFLLTRECHAHPDYQQRVLGAQETIDTQLFGFGWPARHRVVPNAATQRWRGSKDTDSSLVRALNRPSGGLGRLLPLSSMDHLARLQHPMVPILSPGPALRGMPSRTVDATALYAGTAAAKLSQVVSAADAVRDLADSAHLQADAPQ